MERKGSWLVTLLAIIPLEDILAFLLKREKSIKAVTLPHNKKPFIIGEAWSLSQAYPTLLYFIDLHKGQFSRKGTVEGLTRQNSRGLYRDVLQLDLALPPALCVGQALLCLMFYLFLWFEYQNHFWSILSLQSAAISSHGHTVLSQKEELCPVLIHLEKVHK